MGVPRAEIWVNRCTSEHAFKPGSEVRGIVKYFIDVPTEYKSVTLTLYGKAKCKWAKFNGNSTITITGKENIVILQLNIIDKNLQKSICLQRGAYEYPFHFRLPEDIPSSYKDNKSFVIYFVQLKFVKAAFFSCNRKLSFELPVRGFVKDLKLRGTSVSDEPLILGLKKNLFAPFAAKTPMVDLKVEIANGFITPGEKVHLICTVLNTSAVAITAVKVELYHYTVYAVKNHSHKKKGKVKECNAPSLGIASGTAKTFTSVVPTLPKLSSIQHSRIISKEFVVRVTVQLPMPYSNASLDIPILLGERKQNTETTESNTFSEEMSPLMKITVPHLPGPLIPFHVFDKILMWRQ